MLTTNVYFIYVDCKSRQCLGLDNCFLVRNHDPRIVEAVSDGPLAGHTQDPIRPTEGQPGAAVIPGASPRIFECVGSNRRQGGQPTPKYPKNRKTPDFGHFILESGGWIETPDLLAGDALALHRFNYGGRF